MRSYSVALSALVGLLGLIAPVLFAEIETPFRVRSKEGALTAREISREGKSLTFIARRKKRSYEFSDEQTAMKLEYFLAKNPRRGGTLDLTKTPPVFEKSRGNPIPLSEVIEEAERDLKVRRLKLYPKLRFDTERFPISVTRRSVQDAIKDMYNILLEETREEIWAHDPLLNFWYDAGYDQSENLAKPDRALITELQRISSYTPVIYHNHAFNSDLSVYPKNAKEFGVELETGTVNLALLDALHIVTPSFMDIKKDRFLDYRICSPLGITEYEITRVPGEKHWPVFERRRLEVALETLGRIEASSFRNLTQELQAMVGALSNEYVKVGFQAYPFLDEEKMKAVLEERAKD